MNGINRCVVCGVDMGDCNPRQYCCKTYCPMENYDDDNTLVNSNCNNKDKHADKITIIDNNGVVDKETDDGIISRCVVCDVDMGECNPRQYCRKTYCEKYPYAKTKADI